MQRFLSNQTIVHNTNVYNPGYYGIAFASVSCKEKDSEIHAH